MDKSAFLLSMHNNRKYLHEMGIFDEEKYKCPLCLQSFSDEEVLNNLTEEDVPQKSLGGKRILLTCKKCNNTSGYSIDIHLLNAIKGLEQRQYLPSTEHQVTVIDSDKRLNAKVKIDDERNINLEINTKRNNPAVWNFFKESILLKDNVINLKNNPLKRDERFISAALLKNAYFMLFARTGYTFLTDSFYNELREQICNPKPYILPERLWTMQNLYVCDGIYLSKNNQLRGFFVIYTISLKHDYRVCVFIPVPTVPFLSAAYLLRELTSNTRVPIEKLSSNFDFLNNKDDMMRLRNWCYGWNLKF